MTCALALRFMLSPPVAYPLQESLHSHAFAPHQAEEFARIELGCILAKESFQPPLQIWRSPRTQTVPLSNNPVIPKGVQHGEPGARITS
jgi:hypothetical protein